MNSLVDGRALLGSMVWLFLLVFSGSAFSQSIDFWNGCSHTYNFDESATGDKEILAKRKNDYAFVSQAKRDFNMQGWEVLGDPFINNNAYSLMLNSLYVLREAGSGSKNGMIIRGAYRESMQWIKKLSPVCSFSNFENVIPGCSNDVDACSIPNYSDIFSRNPNSVEFKVSSIPKSNVVGRAGLIYHEALHAKFWDLGEDHGGFSDGSVVGREIMWNIYFAADANPSFSDDLRKHASNNVRGLGIIYAINIKFPANINPRIEVYPKGSWFSLPIRKTKLDPPGTVSEMMEEYPCYMTYGNRVHSWDNYPPPGVCYFYITQPVSEVNNPTEDFVIDSDEISGTKWDELPIGTKICEFSDPKYGTTTGCQSGTVGGYGSVEAFKITRDGELLMNITKDRSTGYCVISGVSQKYTVSGTCLNFRVYKK